MPSRDQLKEVLQSILDRLPPEATIRHLIVELENAEAIDAGLRDVEEGRVMSFDEFRKRSELCLSK